MTPERERAATDAGAARAVSGRWGAPLLLAGLVAAFVLGLGALLSLRLDHGDVYPRYSTLRADPLGTKALHDALGLCGLDVERLYLPPERAPALRDLPPGRGGREREVLILLALPVASRISRGRPGALNASPPETVDALEAFAISGGRLVLTLDPVERRPLPAPRPLPTGRAREGTERDRDPAAEGPAAEGREEGPRPSSLARRLGLGFTYAPPGDVNAARGDAVAVPGAGIEPRVPLRTALRLRLEAPVWRPLLLRDGEPVLAERRLGRGSVIVFADTFALSNEALRSERRPQLLAALAGSASRAFFDESHLGVRENPGTMTLIRRHHLHGVLVTLLVLAALLVWKTGLPLVPRLEEGVQGGADGPEVAMRSGRDQGEALVNLLRRSVAPGALLGVCLEEWARTEGRAAGAPPRASGMPGMAAASGVPLDPGAVSRLPPDPAAAYRHVAHLLEERRLRGTGRS